VAAVLALAGLAAFVYRSDSVRADYCDPKDPCSSVITNPVGTRLLDQAMLLFLAVLLAASFWVTRMSGRPWREMTWQVS
jgi:hypothetical protein